MPKVRVNCSYLASCAAIGSTINTAGVSAEKRVRVFCLSSFLAIVF